MKFATHVRPFLKTMLMRSWILAAFAASTCPLVIGKPFTLMDKVTTQCELEALSVGTRLADHYNSYDEDTEWDTRIHNDYLVEHLGFAGWIQMGLYKNTKLTAGRQDAPALHQVMKRFRVLTVLLCT